MKTRIAATAAATLIVGGASLTPYSDELRDFLIKWEGRENVVYADKIAGGLPTVCSGITKYTSPYPVIVGEHWNNAKCDAVEKIVVERIQTELAKCIARPIPQGVFDALSSHAFNNGYPKTCDSQTVKSINNGGSLKAACDLIAFKPNGEPNWSFSYGKFIQGLHNRRKAERYDLCLKGVEQQTSYIPFQQLHSQQLLAFILESERGY